MTSTNPHSLYIHDETCAHCPVCEHMLDDPDMCLIQRPPHWTLDDGYGIKGNLKPVEDAPEPPVGPLPTAPPALVSYWVVFPGGERVRIRPGRAVEIGRDVQPELRIYPHVAGIQASVEVSGDFFFVRDVGTEGNGSMNGTWVNNEKLDHTKPARRLAETDTLRFADQTVELRRERE